MSTVNMIFQITVLFNSQIWYNSSFKKRLTVIEVTLGEVTEDRGNRRLGRSASSLLPTWSKWAEKQPQRLKRAPRTDDAALTSALTRTWFTLLYKMLRGLGTRFKKNKIWVQARIGGNDYKIWKSGVVKQDNRNWNHLSSAWGITSQSPC